MKEGKKFETVDEYLTWCPPEAKVRLTQLRKIVKQAAPQAQETISYNMPAYKLNGVLVYFAGYKGHIGFYPTSSGIEAFRQELAAYEISKGTVRFALDKPLPLKLISQIVKFRAKINSEKAKAKK